VPGITRADIAAFRTRGYLVLPGTLDARLVASGRAIAATMLAAQPGPAGSVVLAHYLLGHNIGGHDGPAGASWRQVAYYRLHATGH
jgi:hypothetical protein